MQRRLPIQVLLFSGRFRHAVIDIFPVFGSCPLFNNSQTGKIGKYTSVGTAFSFESFKKTLKLP